MERNIGLVTREVELAAARVDYLSPRHIVAEADQYLANPEFADAHAQWNDLRDIATALVYRCDVALERLDGKDAALVLNDDRDLQFLEGIRAPILNALQACLDMTRAWRSATKSTIAAFHAAPGGVASLTPENRQRYDAFAAELHAYDEAERRLTLALEVFLPYRRKFGSRS